MQKLIDAIAAAKNDPNGGKVMLSVEDAESLLPNYQDAGMYDPSVLQEMEDRPPVTFEFKRSTPGNPIESFTIIPLRLVFGVTKMWPNEPKWYIEGINTEVNRVGLFALDCFNGIK